MKKIVKWLHTQRILVFAVLVMALLGIGATMALFTDTEAAVNTFKVGKNTITVDETPVGLAKENIGITNTGTVPVYVRMQVNVPNGIKYLAKQSDGTEVEKTLIVKFNPESPEEWIEEEDGFWYYTQVLEPEKSKVLFEKVELVDSKTMEKPFVSEEQMETLKDLLDITVYGESVQSTGFPDEVMKQIQDEAAKDDGNPAKIAFDNIETKE